jgi:hypothetical protein
VSTNISTNVGNNVIEQRSQLEYDLQYRLNNIIERIKAKEINQISTAQSLYNEQVEGLLRKTAIQAYDLGADHTDSKLKLFYVTEDELLKEHQHVNELVTEYAPRFWRKVSKVIHRNDTLLQKYDFVPRSPLNSNYMATSTAIGLITRAIAIGTIDKLNLSKNISASIKGAAIDTTRNQVEWIATLDNNTCDVCAELDGQLFDEDDPDIPMPGEVCDGGDNCRCFYDVIPGEEADLSEVEEDDEITAEEF